jgi:hypothetical protein
MQNPDLKTILDTKVSLAKPVHANAADSGVRVDRAGYGCMMASVSSGVADNGTATGNVVVLIDSIAGTAAWNLIDSVTVDTVDNKTYKMGYKGVNRWVRLLARASGQSADTFAINGIIVLGCKRSG